jgi:hypothetical protein
MNLLAALLLFTAPTASPVELPPAPRAGVSVTARASVVIVRAERVGAQPDPAGVERRTRQTPQGLLVEFT